MVSSLNYFYDKLDLIIILHIAEYHKSKDVFSVFYERSLGEIMDMIGLFFEPVNPYSLSSIDFAKDSDSNM